MALIDFILNVAALLLWLNWLSLRFDPLRRTTPATLVGTLKAAQPRRLRGWQLLASIGLLLVLRAWLYWGIGAPAGWTARLHLGLVVLPFRTDHLDTILLYSLLSFGRALIVFYFWLIVVVMVNRSRAEGDPITKLLRLHLGRLATWPWWIQLLLPLLVVAGLWTALNPLLAHLHVTAQARSAGVLIEQAALVALGLVLTLKFIIPAFLFLDLVLTYVYLGNSAVWEFVSGTATQMLRPLRALPLRLGKLDFAPLVGVGAVFLVLHWLPDFVVATLRLTHSVWPQ